MASSAPMHRSQIRPVPIAAGVIALILLIVAGIYLSRPQDSGAANQTASAEAKAYVKNLQLSDVDMKATENFMQQRVVEIEGKITNAGDRPVRSIDVFCLFAGVSGREIYRERLAIVPPQGKPLNPGEARNFRLPFDSLPADWNQAMPHLVIAQIQFAR